MPLKADMAYIFILIIEPLTEDNLFNYCNGIICFYLACSEKISGYGRGEKST